MPLEECLFLQNSYSSLCQGTTSGGRFPNPLLGVSEPQPNLKYRNPNLLLGTGSVSRKLEGKDSIKVVEWVGSIKVVEWVG